MNILSLKQVSFSYDVGAIRPPKDRRAGESPLQVQGISLEIPEGDFLGILGPNGSGKTTLLRLLSGVLSPQQGEVTLLGEKLGDYSPRQRAQLIAVVPQENDILFPFTVREIVLMGRWPYLGAFRRENAQDLSIVDQAMEATDCQQFAHRPITELSGGEKERVFIARALAQQPKILLLDEPTTHLDLKHQWAIQSLLLRLNQEQGITVGIVLHDLNMASILCRRLLLLQEGKRAHLGTPGEVVQADRIEEVFGTRVSVQKHPQSESPYVFPLLPEK